MSKLGLQVNYDHPITLELRRQICGAPSIRMFYGQNLMKGGTKCNAKIWPLPLGLNTHKYVEPAIISLFFLKGRVPTKSSYRTGGLLVGCFFGHRVGSSSSTLQAAFASQLSGTWILHPVRDRRVVGVLGVFDRAVDTGGPARCRASTARNLPCLWRHIFDTAGVLVALSTIATCRVSGTQ